MDINQLPEILSMKQACEVLHCHANTLRTWEEKGLIKSIRFGVRRDRRFKKADVLQFIESDSKKETGKQLLPSTYDLSRIDMTGTQYEGIEQTAFEHFHNYDDVDRQVIDSFPFKKFRSESEQHIQYFTEKDFKGCTTVEEKVLRIITASRYRSGSLEAIHLEKYKDRLLATAREKIKARKPIVFMLPAFPFKITNPLKSLRGDADLAEVGTFLRFNEINLQIRKVYNPGAQFVVFHDGHLYYQHFLHELTDAERYFVSLRRFVRELGLEKVIEVRDAQTELQHIPEFVTKLERSRLEIKNLWDTEGRNNEKVNRIVESAKSNVSLKAIPYHILYRINFSPEWDLTSDELKVKEDINRRANNCAFEYMVVQHALEKCDFFNRRVPGGIRLTVHPKEGQIGIFLVKRKTFLLPWMGAGVLKSDGSVSVHYESELLSNGKYYPVFIKGEKFPFYYKEVETVYQGREGFTKLFEQVTNSLTKKDHYWAFAFNAEYIDADVRHILAAAHERLAEKKIQDRVICRAETLQAITQTFSGNQNIEIRSCKNDVPTGVIILKDRIINLLWGDKPAAYEIKTKEIVERYQHYFLELWGAK